MPLTEGLVDWVAHLVDGPLIRRAQTDLHCLIEPGRLRRMLIKTDVPSARQVEVLLDTKKGGFAGAFTRRLRCVNGPGGTDVVVVEVMPDPAEPQRWVRLYITPQGKLILSTEDLYEF